MRTKMFKVMKQNIGNMNQLYITCRVGLSMIDDKTTIPDSLRTTWNPINYQISVARSELFLKKTTLIYLFEIIEEYFFSVLKNKIFCINTSDHKVSNIFEVLSFIETEYSLDQRLLDYVFIMRIFRNYLVHGDYRLNNSGEYKAIKSRMIKSKNYYSEKFNNIDITKTLDSIDKIVDKNGDANPTFKEVATCNTIVFLLAEEFEREFLSGIDLKSIIVSYLTTEIDEVFKSKMLNNIKQGNHDRVVNSVKNNIRHNLMHINDNDFHEIIRKFVDEKLEEVL